MTYSQWAGLRPRLALQPASRTGRYRFALFCCFAPLLLAAGSAVGQTDGEEYTALWSRGEYHDALSLLKERLENTSGWTRRTFQRDLVKLEFAVGQVDAAIETSTELTDTYGELQDAVQLAELYQYHGDMEGYTEALRAANELSQRLMRYGMDQEDFLAAGKLAELRGDDPKRILGTHYKVLIEQRPSFVDAYIAAGTFAIKHRGYDVGAGYFRSALELRPENQDALAGLLECYWRVGDNPERMEELRSTLLALNPNHPLPRAIDTEQLLDTGQADEALQVISAALAINPNDLHFLSTKAAAYFLQDKPEAMKAVQQEALAFNPMCSEVYREPGRVAARHYRFTEAAEFQRAALAVDPLDHEARAELAFNLLRKGDADEGKPLLEDAFEADPMNVQAFNMLNVLDSLDGFATLERGPFVLRMPEYEASLLSDDMVDLLEQEIALYEDKYAVTLERPIYIEVFDDHDEFMVRSVGLPGNAGHLGICFGQLITMDSPRARAPGSTNWHSVLWHEFVHVITLQKTKNRMPRWLSEGISVYEETRRNAAWGTAMDMNFKPIYLATPKPTLTDLESYFTAPRSAQHLMYGYFSAGEFVAFYTDAYGQPALVDALERIGGGEKAGPALAEAAGVDDGGLTEGFAVYLARRCAPFGNLADPPAPDAAEGGPGHGTATPWISQPSPYVDTIRAAMDAWEDKDFDTAAAKLDEAYGLYPDDKSQNAPLRLLARVYGDAGKEDKRLETLERIVAWDPTALSECMTLAKAYTEQEEWAGVLRVTRIAQGIAPFDAELLRTQATAMARSEDYLDAADRYGRLARIDENREGDYRMERARALEAGGASTDAKHEVLTLLERMPRYWDAQALLLELTEEQPMPETADVATP